MIPWWGPRTISSNFATGHATIPYQFPKAKVQRRDVSDDDLSVDAG